MGNGWIALHRELMDKPIWLTSTPEQKVILITLLLMANHKENEWEWNGEKYKVKPGQFITSLPSIQKKCGKNISIQNIRTAIARFEKYEFLTSESTNKNRLITIGNWDFYQNEKKNQQANQQAANRQLTANNNDNNDNKNIYSPVIEYLNDKTGKNFKASAKRTQSLINARLKEGFTEADLMKVIDINTRDWITDPKMAEYLRPETLFGTKFESYLNSKPAMTSEPEQFLNLAEG